MTLCTCKAGLHIPNKNGNRYFYVTRVLPLLLPRSACHTSTSYTRRAKKNFYVENTEPWKHSYYTPESSVTAHNVSYYIILKINQLPMDPFSEYWPILLFITCYLWHIMFVTYFANAGDLDSRSPLPKSIVSAIVCVWDATLK